MTLMREAPIDDTSKTPGGRLILRQAGQLALGICMAVSLTGQAKGPTPHPGGFWKCKTQSTVKGEFDGEDPVGLASRSHIPTDCALHWSDGHGKTYCFASNPSYLEFDSNPDILPRARAFWSETRH